MKITGGRPAWGDNAPRPLSDCSRRGRPSPSRYNFELLVWWIWLPSASVCVFSVVTSAENGALFTTGPGRPGSAPTTRAPQSGGPPRPCGCADSTAATATKLIVSVRIDIPQLLIRRSFIDQPHGAGHAVGAEHYVRQHGIGGVPSADRNSQRQHGGPGNLHAHHIHILVGLNTGGVGHGDEIVIQGESILIRGCGRFHGRLDVTERRSAGHRGLRNRLPAVYQ